MNGLRTGREERKACDFHPKVENRRTFHMVGLRAGRHTRPWIQIQRWKMNARLNERELARDRVGFNRSTVGLESDLAQQ